MKQNSPRARKVLLHYIEEPYETFLQLETSVPLTIAIT